MPSKKNDSDYLHLTPSQIRSRDLSWRVEEKEQTAWIACQQLDGNQLLAEVFER